MIAVTPMCRQSVRAFSHPNIISLSNMSFESRVAAIIETRGNRHLPTSSVLSLTTLSSLKTENDALISSQRNISAI